MRNRAFQGARGGCGGVWVLEQVRRREVHEPFFREKTQAARAHKERCFLHVLLVFFMFAKSTT